MKDNKKSLFEVLKMISYEKYHVLEDNRGLSKFELEYYNDLYSAYEELQKQLIKLWEAKE